MVVYWAGGVGFGVYLADSFEGNGSSASTRVLKQAFLPGLGVYEGSLLGKSLFSFFILIMSLA